MIILGTNSIKDTGYDVDNSVRVQTGAYMSGSNGTTPLASGSIGVFISAASSS